MLDSWTYKMFLGLKRIARFDANLRRECKQAALYLIHRLNRNSGGKYKLSGPTGTERWNIVTIVPVEAASREV